MNARAFNYYASLVADEAAAGEPELGDLAGLIGRRGLAVDVGANRGLFAFALSEVSQSVCAFEANPAYASFARDMLGPLATVYEVALSDRPGRGTFYVPYNDEGEEMHFAGNLKNSHSYFQTQKTFDVEIRTLDSYALHDVSFLKVDVEGSELEVLTGGRETIMRERPVMLLELLTGGYADPAADARRVCDTYSYDAFIYDKGDRLDAFSVISRLGSNSTWGTDIATRNVLFTPR
jgi:FkbM family methyltransferase